MGETGRPTPETKEICAVVGTRPEIIKMAPVIRSLRDADEFSVYLVHTGQHYDESLSRTFFETLELPRPDAYFDVGSDTHGSQTAAGLTAVESVLSEREPAAILSQGDTNAVLSTALAAAKLPVAFGHVEAGIRSFDRGMPEEINRVIADTVADYRFAPTEQAAENLAAEGITDGVFVTGNTVVDACLEHGPIASEKSDLLDRYGLVPDEYVVATIHRARNTDDRSRLRTVLETLDGLDLPVLFPAHPRTAEAIETTGFSPEGSLVVVEPLGYLDFLRGLSEARLAVTDSGGVQEEASILETPCVTVRPNTERPETVDAGVNVLVSPEELEPTLAELLANPERLAEMRGRSDLFGDGTAGERIVDILRTELVIEGS